MVSYERRRHAETRERGDTVSAVQFTGRRVALSADWLTHGSFIPCESKRAGERGFSLIELVITITIMTILTMGVVPGRLIQQLNKYRLTLVVGCTSLIARFSGSIIRISIRRISIRW